MSGKDLGKGIDIGGMSVKIGIVDEDCCIVDKRVIPTDSRIKTQAEVAEAIAEAVCRLAEENHIQMNVMFARVPLGENAKVLSQGGFPIPPARLVVGALGGELSWTPEEAPSLNYRLQCEGGTYTLWMLSKFNVREEGFFGVGVDSELLAKEEVYGKDSLWRYEADLVYRWVLAAQIQLTHGGACAAYMHMLPV